MGISEITLLKEYNNKLTGAPINFTIKDRTGYVKIDEFTDNKKIIKSLQKLITEVKKEGGDKIIIDIRQNPGGNGDRFDELLSLFSNKKSILYQRSACLKVSEGTLDYGFPRDSIGKLVLLPEPLVTTEIPLKPDMYEGDMKYYLLVSNVTGSMAATFTNLFQ